MRVLHKYLERCYPGLSIFCHQCNMALFEAGLVTQLLTFLHDLGTFLDAGDEIDVIYLDFSKAFDSIPHGKLLHKLSLFGFQGPLHAWFTDYLISRSQWVVIDRTFSSWEPVTSGVSQGSILGPFLFLLYVNDLPDVLSTTAIALFADDAKCS